MTLDEVWALKRLSGMLVCWSLSESQSNSKERSGFVKRDEWKPALPVEKAKWN